MLAAIKSRFARLTRSHTAKLLVLEFIVVLAGVLVAQLLQGWFAEREERARAQSYYDGVVAALHNTGELAVIRQRIYLCMQNAIERARDELADPGGSGEDMAWVETPEQMILDETGIDFARPYITRHFDREQMMTLSQIQFLHDDMVTAQNDELAAWSKLKLLRSRNGPLNEDLRADLQVALADAERANRLLYEISGIMRGRAVQLEVPMHETTIEQQSRSPKLCMNMVGYPDQEHSEAAGRGELPDGSRLHPYIRERLGIDSGDGTDPAT